MIFLIEYDRARGEMVRLKTFPDSERHAAEEERLKIEIGLNRDEVEREAVILEAESEGALRKTHRRYFENLTELATPSA